MITAWAFIFGCILCFMFLGMLYGEKLSLIGLLEGRWFEPLPRAMAFLWNQLSLAVDLVVVFVADHLSWVIATVSGGIGLFIVAFLMFSGIADDAAATHRDLQAPLLAGSVLDKVPQLSVREPGGATQVVRAVHDDSELVWQQPGGEYVVFIRPELDRPIAARPRKPEFIDLPDPDLPTTLPTLDQPVLGLTFRRGDFRSMQFEDDSETVTRGQLVVSTPLPQLIERAVRGLRLDDWRMTFADPLGGRRREDLLVTLPESSAAEVRALESRVRVVPGDAVAANELRVEKTVPSESGGAEVTVEINVLNLGIQTVNGLLVREFLPRGTRVRSVEPEAVFRDETLTWLLDNLRPFDERVLRFTVLAEPLAGGSSRRPRFESATEVSAAAAVTSPTVVRSERTRPAPVLSPPPSNRLPPEDLLPLSDPVPRPLLEPATDNRRLPEIAGRPDVRLSILEPRDTVQVGENVEVNFVVENRGDAPAVGVGLRVTLDRGLSHHTLTGNELQRQVINGVRRLEPGEKRTIVLRMRALQPGEFISSAEMIFEGAQLSLDTFRIVADQRRSTPPLAPAVQ